MPLLAGSSLIVLNSGSGSLSSVALKLPAKHRLAAPQALGQKVYIPDQSTGSLFVYDSATNRMEPQVPVTGRPGPLDAFVKDGLLWVNGPDSAKAVVVDGSGAHRPIKKYSPDVPGSENNPIPKAGTPGGDRGKPAPGGGPAAAIPRAAAAQADQAAEAAPHAPAGPAQGHPAERADQPASGGAARRQHQGRLPAGRRRRRDGLQAAHAVRA